MTPNKPQKSSIETIREKLYREVEQNEKKEYFKAYFLFGFCIAILLVASILFFIAASIESNKPETYTYYFNGEEQKIDISLAFDGKIQYIDMRALANHCGISQNASENQITFTANNTKATFVNKSSKAKINDIEIEMPSKAIINGEYCLVPIDTAKSILHGVHFLTQNEHTNISTTNDKVFMIVKGRIDIDYETNIDEFLPYIHSNDAYIYKLVNKQHSVDANFPSDKDALIEIPAQYRKQSIIYLYYVAEYALEAMMQDMFYLEYDDVYVTSAYRSYSYQNTVFERYVTELLNQNSNMSRAEAEAIVGEDTAIPGQSEHQTGLCVDFTTTTIRDVDNRFAQTEAYAWLIDNSWKYGFVLRYPEDKYDIVQYKYESWHFRFVGFEVASIMHQTGLCFEEYIEVFGK